MLCLSCFGAVESTGHNSGYLTLHSIRRPCKLFSPGPGEDTPLSVDVASQRSRTLNVERSLPGVTNSAQYGVADEPEHHEQEYKFSLPSLSGKKKQGDD